VERRRQRQMCIRDSIEGIKTTIPFHQKLMDNPDFNAGNFTTKFMETFDF
jgi:acetyl-CoA carboxylase biotin carboxylase subunit